ncbi:MAG: ribosome small subunit-dependent GTPase A, partial [Clostridiales bacterium]
MPKNCPDDACSSNEDFTQGIILRGIGGFYTVLLENAQRITCKQRGKLRKKDGGLYPGDKVLITITDDQEGMLEQVLPRKNQLNRPKVANISKAFMVLSAKNPKPDWLLLDRMLVMAAYHNIEPSICFNKWDILTDEEQQEIQEILQTYKNAGFAVFYLSALKNDGLEILKDALKNQISVFTGP